LLGQQSAGVGSFLRRLNRCSEDGTTEGVPGLNQKILSRILGEKNLRRDLRHEGNAVSSGDSEWIFFICLRLLPMYPILIECGGYERKTRQQVTEYTQEGARDLATLAFPSNVNNREERRFQRHACSRRSSASRTRMKRTSPLQLWLNQIIRNGLLKRSAYIGL